MEQVRLEQTKTAVEWLYEQLLTAQSADEIQCLWEMALKKEEEQIMEAYKIGLRQ